MALTKVTGQVINTSTDVTVGVLTVTNTLAVGGTVSIGGTLTYEDVTNIDSVGLITARNGIVVGSGITLSSDGDGFFTGVVTATSYAGDGSALNGIAATDNVRTGILDVAGIATFRSNTLVGSGITLSPDGDGFFTGITTAKSASFGGGVLQESFHNDTSAVSGTHNHDALTYGMVWNGSTNAGGSFVINLRGDASTTFNSLIGIGKVATMTIYSANNNASNYMTAFQIDGSAQTIKYANATTPSAATGSGVDVYSLTILKTAANTYSVFGNFTNFA